VFNFILSNIPQIQKDFEVKRVIIGLGALTLSDNSSGLDPQVQARFSDFINAIVLLCQKSIELRQKKIQKLKDEENEEAVEDQECEREAIFEEDDEDGIELGDDEDDYNDSEDNWDVEDEDELDNELYDTKIDKIDEILFIQEQIGVL
jgi:preprotein translocase subunit Sec63